MTKHRGKKVQNIIGIELLLRRWLYITENNTDIYKTSEGVAMVTVVMLLALELYISYSLQYYTKYTYSYTQITHYWLWVLP